MWNGVVVSQPSREIEVSPMMLSLQVLYMASCMKENAFSSQFGAVCTVP